MKEAGTPEFYYPEAMKRKLAKYPVLRQRTGLSEVKTCNDARVFAQGYGALLKERPDVFGDNTVLAQLAAIQAGPESEDVASTTGSGLGTEPGAGDGKIGVTRQAILNGGLVVNNAAVRVGTSSGGVKGNWCSGVSISKFHTVTAAHCLNFLPNGWFRGVIQRQACNASTCWPVDTLYSEMWLYLSRHPNYTHLGDFDDDLAIVTIYHVYDDGTVTFPPPNAGNAMRIWLGGFGAGQGLDIYGWGASTPSGGFDRLRIGGMTLASAPPNYIWAYVQSQGPCVQDSGGPAVVQFDKAAGVHGYRSNGALCPPTNGSNWVTWARLDAKMSWLEGQMWYPFGTGYVCPKFNNGSGLYARCW